MDQSSPYVGYWPSRGQNQQPGASSPTGVNPAIATPGAHTGLNEPDLEDASFAASYRAEASPLFNSLFQPRTNPGPSVVSLGMPDDATPTRTWTWQPESSVLDPNHEVTQSSPILGHDVPTRNEPAPFSQPGATSDEDIVPESTPGDELRLSQAAPSTFETISQQLAEGAPKAVVTEASIDIEIGAHDDEAAPVDSTVGLSEQTVVDEQRGLEGLQEEPTEPEATEVASPRSIELEQAEIDTQLDESITGENTLPSPRREEPVLSHSVSQEDVPESAQRQLSGLTSGAESDRMDVDIPASTDADQPPPSSPDGLAATDAPTAGTAKKIRRRRSANDLLHAIADTFVQRDYEDRRKRRASAPPTKASQSKTPQAKASRTSARTSTARATRAPVPKAGRKSMPAKLATETPKKRGRPRKSEGAATPATVTKSAIKRGRPKTVDATPASKTTAAKPAGSARSQRALKVTKTTVITKTTATPRRSVGRPATPRTAPHTQNVATGAAWSSTPVDGVPKRRGRPPKSTQNTPARPAATPRSARLAKLAQTEPPKKRGQPITPRAVPSPIKRGRPARKTASPVKDPQSTNTEPKKRGRPSAIIQAEPTPLSSPSSTPKRRGRPPKNPAPVSEVQSLKEPVTKKRGRGALTEDGDIPAELPPPTRKRGRAAKTEAEEHKEEEPASTKRRGRSAATSTDASAELPASTRKRGRAAKSDAPEESGEPITKKRRTATQKDAAPTKTAVRKRGRGQEPVAVEPVDVLMEEQVAPSKGRGRGRKAAAPEAVPPPAGEPKPKGRGRGRKATAEVAEAPVEEEAVKPKGHGKGRKASTTEVVEAAAEEVAKPKGRGRGRKTAAPEAVEAAVEEEAAKPKSRSRAKRSAPEPEPAVAEPAEEAPKAGRRGRAAAKAVEVPATEEPAKPKGKGRGRQAAVKVEAPAELVEEEPKTTRRGGRAAKSGKGELPSSKAVTEEAPKRKGRAAKVAPEGALVKAAAPKGVVKKAAAPKKAAPKTAAKKAAPKKATTKAAPVATRSLRSRG